MKIDPTSQSLISLGGSPEEDRRFDRAIRLNGARELSNFTHVIPPASAGTVDTGETVVQPPERADFPR